MSTYTAHDTISRRSGGTTAWTLQHPMIATLAALAAAVLAGVLIGILFSVVLSGTGAAAQHRAGGHHALAAALARQQPATTAATAKPETATITTATIKRSPARGGVAVGRSAGAGSGFIEVRASAADPAGGGFPGRALGAGRVPAAALPRTASVD